MTAPTLTPAASAVAPPGRPGRGTPSPLPPAPWRTWQETRVNIAAHPLLWPASRLVQRFGRVVRVPGLGVVVNDAELGHDVLVHDARYVKQGEGGIAAVMSQAFGPSALANMDGEPHRALRQRLGPLASPAQADAWLAEARNPIDRAVAALVRGERVDVARTARALSGRLTLTLMGIAGEGPDADAEAIAVHEAGERIASALRLGGISARRLARVRGELDGLLQLSERAAAAGALPPASLVARLHALGCSPDEVRGLLSIFFVAGALTLGVTLPRLVALLVDTGQLGLVREDPALAARAVDEGLRYTCPVPLTLRLAAEDTVLGGLRVRRGDRVVVLTANMARDPRLFPAPHRFDITRAPEPRARYLWYGAGPHFCLGFTLAQRTLQHAVGALAALGSLRVVSRWPRHGVLLPAWHRLVLHRTRGAL
jgi:cytochrome P450